MSYDSKCLELSRHFLGGLAPDDLVELLAQHIQTSIEEWMAECFASYTQTKEPMP